jgi:hypothetical protein
LDAETAAGLRIRAERAGTAASAQDFGDPGARSFSADYVTIVPPGWWWA